VKGKQKVTTYEKKVITFANGGGLRAPATGVASLSIGVHVGERKMREEKRRQT
jgi:hypothetical protein